MFFSRTRFPPTQVAPLSTFAPEMTREEETEKAEDLVDLENYSVGVAEMDNHSVQMVGHNNTFEAQHIPLEKEPLVLKGIQASNYSRCRERANNNKSLNLTEMVNKWDNEGGEANSVGQSSPMVMETVEVEGYQVRAELESIARKVLTKHEDLFKNCTLSSMAYCSMLLEMICDIISELQEKDLHKITEAELNSMIGLANEIKDMKVNIEWLILRLQEVLETKQILNQSGILKEKKYINEKIVQTARRELEECEAEKKKLQSIFDKIYDKETACKETLAIAQDEAARISQTITYAESKVRPFVNCSLVDGLL